VVQTNQNVYRALSTAEQFFSSVFLIFSMFKRYDTTLIPDLMMAFYPNVIGTVLLHRFDCAASRVMNGWWWLFCWRIICTLRRDYKVTGTFINYTGTRKCYKSDHKTTKWT